MIIVSKPSKAIRAPIVWNRPTAGMFDYHYDLAGLYYQVVVIALNAKALVKETDTPPPADDQLLSRARGGWSSEGGRLARSSRVQLWQESLVRCFSPPRLWFQRNHIKLWHFPLNLSLIQKKPCLITAHAVLMKATMTSSWRWCTNAGWRTRTPNQVNL